MSFSACNQRPVVSSEHLLTDLHNSNYFLFHKIQPIFFTELQYLQFVLLLLYAIRLFLTYGENNIQSKGDGKKSNGGFNKVTVIGAGDLGLACVLAISAKSVADKVVVLDCSEGSVKGGTMDLEIFALPKVEVSRDFSASADSKVVVLTVNSLGNAESYLDVVQNNVELFRGIIPSVAQYSPHSVLLVASQPGFYKTCFIKVGFKLDMKKTKIMASGPITSWLIDGEEMEVVTDFIFFGSKITANGDCSQEIKRCLFLGRKAMANLDSILKSREITLLTKVCIVKAMVFPVVMYGCEIWIIKC
ncbi:Ubiquitin-conjugating enzyme E2 variant 3 [Varanus komodoensis]|nr:Ubiquitin-conjugating enzyme E2 variant 3 [Varanus komodoensis]